MYRVLIVDDEAIIADGLYEELSICGLDLDVYKAYSGRGALELLARHRIDVVVTDIRMPGMDGMALMESIRGNWPECRVIFLTGHREFDYVYKAIQHKGLQYVLKTEGYARVISAVEKAIDDIETEMRLNDRMDEMRRRADSASMHMQGDYLKSLTEGWAAGPCAPERDFEECGIGLLAAESVLLVAGRLSPPPEPSGYSDTMRAHRALKLAAERYLTPSLLLAYLPDGRDDAVLFVQPARLADCGEGEREALWEGARRFLQGTLELMQASVKALLGRTVSFCLAEAPSAWADVPKAYQSIRHRMNCRIGAGEEMLLTGSGEGSEAPALAFAREPAQGIRQNADALSAYLERGEREEYMKVFDGFAAELAQAPGRQGGAAQEAYYSLALMLLSHLNRWQLTDKVRRADPGALMRPDRFQSREQGLSYLRQLSSEIFEIQNADQDRRASDILKRVKTYVDAHLGDDLSLLKLSDIMFFNPSYLSRLFKQLSGENLTGYIQAKRIEKAKSMLGRNEHRVNDIAVAVGFGSATNFTRFFKKETGMTPVEYRDRLSDRKAGIEM